MVENKNEGISLGLGGWVVLQIVMFVLKYSFYKDLPWYMVWFPSIVIGVILSLLIIILIIVLIGSIIGALIK